MNDDGTTPRIRVRIDHDGVGEAVRIDCTTCGAILGTGISAEDVGGLALAETVQHVCRPTAMVVAV